MNEVKINSTEVLIRNVYDVVLDNVYYTYKELMTQEGEIKEWYIFGPNEEEIKGNDELTKNIQFAVDTYLRKVYAKVQDKITNKE
jgi:hypothetical protein